MKVEIKERTLKGGNRSLYLEYYEKGFRKRENLHLYLIPEDAPDAKSINKRTYLKAMAVRSDRILNPSEFDKKPESEDGIDRTITWLEWCDEYIRYSAGCGNGESAMQQKMTVRKRISEYLDRISRTDILLKDVTKEVICGLYDYMRNNYRNPGQIKVREGRLSDYSLRHFGETINAIFNKALREGLIGYNPLRGLNKLERTNTVST